MEYGEPVKPWLRSTPIRFPPVRSGRAVSDNEASGAPESARLVMGASCPTSCAVSGRLSPGVRTRSAERRGARVCHSTLDGVDESVARVGGGPVFYWFLKWVALGPWLKLVFRPRVQ